MGYDVGHITAHGHSHMSENQKRQALGDSFQVETVCYFLEPIKRMQDEGKLPREGLTVLSLFDGIGGLAVVMHRMGIKMRKYVTCEIKRERNHVVAKFFEHVCRDTEYVPLGDIETGHSHGQGASYSSSVSSSSSPLDEPFIESLVNEAGVDGLLIGAGSPCNDLAGTNRHRVGIGGQKSVLFFEVSRVIAMATKARLLLDRKMTAAGRRGN